MSAKKGKPVPKNQRNQYLQVYVRCRPLSDSENRHPPAVEIHHQRDIAVQDRTNPKISKTYSFDRVFTPEAKQAEIFQAVVGPLISDVLTGYNCTVFAYGQTGSGKTFTMEGDIGSCSPQVFGQDSMAGLIPRAMCALFDELRVLQSEYTVRISLMELYNEELYDLLSPDEVPPKLRLFEDPTRKGSAFVQGLQEVMVHTQTQVLAELRKGSAKRQVAATLMNAQSSRSHTIFTVTVHYKESSVDGEELMRTGKLNLVDLAGSENIGRSGSVDKRAREAASINQSLLTLSRVTACLVEHQPHVPYRESKLTRLLQDSLGGRTKTSLIANISPAHCNLEETLSTLDYAHRAKCVANRPEVNQKVSQTVIMKEYTDLIEDLKKKLDLHRTGSGVYVNDENYKQIMEGTKERNQRIIEISGKIRDVYSRKKSTEEIFEALSSSIEKQRINLENVNHTIVKTSEEISKTKDVLARAKTEQSEAKSILKTLSEKENELRTQADHLAQVAESAHEDSDKIHNRLDFSRVVLVENTHVLNKVKDTSKFKIEAAMKIVSSLSTWSQVLSKLLSVMETLDHEMKSDADIIIKLIRDWLDKVSAFNKKVRAAGTKLMERGKGLSLKAQEFGHAVNVNFAKIVDGTDQELRRLYEVYSEIVSQFPLQCASLVEFVRETSQNMKETAKVKFAAQNELLSTISTDSNLRTLNLINLIQNIQKAHEIPLDCMAKQMKVLKLQNSDINTSCVKAKEEIAAHKSELLMLKENRMNEIISLKENMTADVEHFKQLETGVKSGCMAMSDASCAFKDKLTVGLQERTESIKAIVSEVEEMESKAVEEAQKLLHYDHESPSHEILKECNNVISENASTLDSIVTSAQDLVQCSQEFHTTVSAKIEDVQKKLEEYQEAQNESLSKFINNVKSTSSEVAEDLDVGRTVINEILSTELSHDAQTGLTPVRKSYGSIPKPSALPSPVLDKVKMRVQRAPWKKLLRSPRKPLTSTMSLNDEDECMASDSEVTNNMKREMGFGLQKASSLSDLRNPVFHRPRVPKKYSRKPL